MSNYPTDGPPNVNPPMEPEASSSTTEKPPAVSSEDMRKMVEAGLAANRKDWDSEEVDLTGAGPQPLDDSAFNDE